MKTNKAYIVVGLGYGDEGKGTIVDYLSRKNNVTLVVRFNGGSQAGHNVVTEGRHHTFSQFGSGSFVPGVRTLLSRFVLFDPIALAEEANSLSHKIGENALDRMFVDFRTPCVTPFHVAANRIKEWMRGGGRHGSCGKGIGETASDVVNHPDEIVHVRDLAFPERTRETMEKIQRRKFAELQKIGADFGSLPDFLKGMGSLFTDARAPENIAQSFADIAEYINIVNSSVANRMIRESNVIFEGAQGVLLDEWHGFHPYATYSSTTSANALSLLKESIFAGETETIGVTRVYGTRHGAGPFITENERLADLNPNEHNYLGEWQGNFRTGDFDAVTLRYAIQCLRHYGKVDSIALTHLDAFLRKDTLSFSDGYFDENAEVIRELLPQFSHDLDYQRELTKSIEGTSPIIVEIWDSPEQAIATIEKVSEVPVKYTSFGPAWTDKHSR